MKTKVRIQQHKIGNFNIKTIQILIKRFNDSITLDSIGYIKFQQTIGEDTWYGLNYDINTSDVSHIENMLKIAKHIKSNSNWDSSPDEILELIGAVEYKVFNHDFVPVSQDGENMYDVIVKPGSLNSRIIAPDEAAAQKILDKKKIEGAALKLNAKITL